MWDGHQKWVGSTVHCEAFGNAKCHKRPLGISGVSTGGEGRMFGGMLAKVCLIQIFEIFVDIMLQFFFEARLLHSKQGRSLYCVFFQVIQTDLFIS